MMAQNAVAVRNSLRHAEAMIVEQYFQHRWNTHQEDRWS
jgi:hypothetical protein